MGSFQGLARGPPSPGDDRSDAKDRVDGKDRVGQAESSQRMMMMHGMEMDMGHSMGGSDVFGFIVGMIKAVVGGVKSIIMNTVAGLSSGASKGSMDLAMKTAQPLSSGSDGLAAQLTT